jgi:hypothetical protein
MKGIVSQSTPHAKHEVTDSTQSSHHLPLLYRQDVRKPLPLILSALLLILLSLIGAFSVIHWLSGDEFHSLLERKCSEALHAKASFGALQWGWFSLSSPHLHAEGIDSSSLRQLDAEGLHGKLYPFDLLHGKWHVEEISLENASIQIDSSRPRNNLQNLTSATAATSSLSGWIPTRVVIEVVHAANANLAITLPSGKSLAILGTHLDAYPEGNEIRIEGNGGVLRNPYLPDLNVGAVYCRLKPSLIELTGADLSFPKGGILHLEGNFPDADESSLDGRWEKVPVATLLPFLSQQLVGSLEGSGTVSWNPEGVRSVAGNVKAKDVTLSHLPLLDQAAQFTGMDLLRHLPVQQAQGTFSVKDGITEWHDVVLESEGLLKLVGEGTVSPEGNILGTFRLGIAGNIASRIPGAPQIFNIDVHDGYLWTPLKIGGTLTHPTEDLTTRLAAAVIGGAANSLLQGVQQILAAPANQGEPPAADTNSQAHPASSPVNSSDPAKAALDILGGILK